MTQIQQQVVPDRAITAIHEAAHAVVALRHDLPFHPITIRPKGGTLGEIQLVTPPPGTYYHCHHLMPAYAAGAIAQDIATGCKDRGITAAQAFDDFGEVRHCARLVRQAQQRGADTGMKLPPRATIRTIATRAWVDAHQIITAEYGAILAIADALLTSTCDLTQPDCERIIGGADPVAPSPAVAAQAREFWPPRFMHGWWIPEQNGRVTDE
jgi:hypothetical protein